MSFVTTRPEALAAAASKLQTIGSSMSAQNAAAAAPTTGVAPAAADEVSALQAAQFSAYGTWYQHVSAQAATMHQMLVNTLKTSAGSYGETEAANQTATSAGSLSAVTGGLTAAAAPAAAADPSSALSSLSGGSLISTSAGSTLGTPLGWGQNFSAAISDLWQPASNARLANPGPGAGLASMDGAGAGIPVGAGAPAGGAAPAAAPVLASAGQATTVGGLSVPPAWAPTGVPAPNAAAPTIPAGAGWTSAAPQHSPVTALPGGMPSMASAGRAGIGFGAPRYGVKPTVMPKPTVV